MSREVEGMFCDNRRGIKEPPFASGSLREWLRVLLDVADQKVRLSYLP